MSRMTRDQALARLLDGIQDDLLATSTIHGLLEQQFQAALRHRGAELAQLADALTPQLDAMEERRRQRVQLVQALFGQAAGMTQLFAALPAERQPGAVAAWAQLETLVRDCKSATTRNASLMAEQHAVMQRLLHGEDQTYAPR
jgi:flagella synthesis protein FlgN